ncbi:MAG: metal-dependent hydrolase, partial [Opitutae bacterium]|nr:metal-dependent hydrolase [Opitutae bacterium]
EIGLNKNSKNELEILERHIEIAAGRDELILVHTPHLEDKLKGTKLIVDAILNQPSIRPERVIIDHVEEHTISIPRDKGFWVGMTLYPESKCTPQRAADMLEVHGTERIWMNSACDWGISNPLAVPEAAFELKRRGETREMIDKVLYQNPRAFLSQCPKFKL